jgi:hypothetical protein
VRRLAFDLDETLGSVVVPIYGGPEDSADPLAVARALGRRHDVLD